MSKKFFLTDNENEFYTCENTILYSSEISYNDSNHLKFNINYLFNTSDKYFNNETKNNFYFDSEKIYSYKERLEQYKLISEMFLKENYKNCRQQLFYLNFEKGSNLNDVIDCLNYLKLCLIELSNKNILPKAKYEYFVLHLNQEYPHFHRIFIIE